MDEDTREVLSEWGLSEYIEIFKENKIDIQCLNILDNDMIKELIRPIGDRAKFTQNISLWKQIQGDSIPQQEPPQDTVYVDVLNEKHRNPPPLNNYENEVFTVTHTDVILSDTQVNLPLADVSNIQPSSEAYSLDCISPSTASTSATNETRNPSSKKLLDLLNKSNKGRNLLKLYKEEGLLTNNGRRVICNIVVEDLLSEDHEKRVPHATLLSIAHEIKTIFPKENISTYYIPYVNNSNMKIKTCAKGKLYDCLHNRKREYREAEKKNTSLKVDQLTNINKNAPNQTDQQEESESPNKTENGKTLSRKLLDIGDNMVITLQKTNWMEPPTPYESEDENVNNIRIENPNVDEKRNVVAAKFRCLLENVPEHNLYSVFLETSDVVKKYEK